MVSQGSKGAEVRALQHDFQQPKIGFYSDCLCTRFANI